MFIDFRVRNHRSLLSEQVLSLEAGSRVADDNRPRTVPGLHQRLLPAVAIYGANASGKSNVLSAFGFMKLAVEFSHRVWEPEGGVPRDPFAWGNDSGEPSLFEVRFIHQRIRYQYGFVVDDDRCIEEWLYAWPQGRKQLWFERDGDTFKFGEHLRGENRTVEEVTRPNALFLSVAAQHNHKQLIPVYAWFRGITTVDIKYGRRSAPNARIGFWLSNLFERGSPSRLIPFFDDRSGEHDGTLDMLREMVRVADVGIEDLRVEVASYDGYKGRQRRRVLVKHTSSSGDAWLPLHEESHGTQTLLHLAFPVLRTLRDGGVLLVDELERSLHPLLAAYVVSQFNNPDTNRLGGQIVFTTHDTNLLGTTLGPALLRRDQVWLTEKDAEGRSCLYPLSDYQPRKAENLERGYLQGRYGAIPFLGSLAQMNRDGA